MDLAPLISLGIVGTGNGGTTIVDTPLAKAQPGTIHQGKNRFKLTEKMIDQMVKNYTTWRSDGGAPAPGYFGHAMTEQDQEIRDKGVEEPILHVLKIWRRGEQLMGRLEFMPWAWEKVWAGGAMPIRGLSIVFTERGTSLAGTQIGAVFMGVDVVPEPLLPVEIAAAKIPDSRPAPVRACSGWLELPTPWRCNAGAPPGDPNAGGGGKPMDEATKELMAELKQQVEDLKKQLADEKDARQKLQEAADKRVQDAEKAQADAEKDTKDLKAEIAASATERKNEDAYDAITEALAEGVIEKSEVEGYDDKDKPNAAAKALEGLKIFRDAKALRTWCSRKKKEKPGEPRGSARMGGRRFAGKPKETEDKTADEKLRLQVQREHPDAEGEDLDDLVAQEKYLAKVDEVQAKLRKERGGEDDTCTYAEAMDVASEQHPEEYDNYLAATGRKR